jgi:cytidylate kinase
MVITIDGPAGSGKSTTARRVARAVGGQLLDTGAIYRCLALEARRHGVDVSQAAQLAELARTLDIRFGPVEDDRRDPDVFLNGQPVTREIRVPEISQAASVVSAHPEVREALLQLQRRLAFQSPDVVVAEGRDMGTVVFPAAKHKFFLEADMQTRARRRHKELEMRGHAVCLQTVLADQQKRDLRDRQRKVAPLRAAEDAVVIDSTDLSPKQVVDRIMAHLAKDGKNA